MTTRFGTSPRNASLVLILLVSCTCEGDKTKAEKQAVALEETIRNGRPVERARAALALWNETGKVEPGLRALLDDAGCGDLQRERAAARFLPQAKAVPGDVIDWVRQTRQGRAMLMTLGALGPAAKKALPAVRAAMAEPDAAVRIAAAWALVRISGTPDEAVAALMAELAKAPVAGRQAIADTLLGIGRVHAERFEALMAGFSKDPVHAEAAAELLRIHRKRDG